MAEREMGDRVTGSKTGDRETRRQGDMQGNGRQVIDNILSLWPNTFKLLLGLFLHRLPLQMRSQLANFPATSPAQLAAEAIWTQSGGQVRAPKVTVAAAIASWPRLPSPCATEAGQLSLVRWWVGLPGNGGRAVTPQCPMISASTTQSMVPKPTSVEAVACGHRETRATSAPPQALAYDCVACL